MDENKQLKGILETYVLEKNKVLIITFVLNNKYCKRWNNLQVRGEWVLCQSEVTKFNYCKRDWLKNLVWCLVLRDIDLFGKKIEWTRQTIIWYLKAHVLLLYFYGNTRSCNFKICQSNKYRHTLCQFSSQILSIQNYSRLLYLPLSTWNQHPALTK